MAILPTTWIDLEAFFVQMMPVPPSAQAEILSTLRDDGLVEIRKMRGKFQVRKLRERTVPS